MNIISFCCEIPAWQLGDEVELVLDEDVEGPQTVLLLPWEPGGIVQGRDQDRGLREPVLSHLESPLQLLYRGGLGLLLPVVDPKGQDQSLRLCRAGGVSQERLCMVDHTTRIAVDLQVRGLERGDSGQV